MPTGPFFTILDKVDSTNNYAMERLHAGMAKHGMAWFAREQTGGKGQRGNSWFTEPGKNIIMSLILEPFQLKPRQQFYLSAAIALCCREFFSHYAGEETFIKWPNDLYWRDRKAGGILIENSIKGQTWAHSVIGIGININQTVFDERLLNPVSLKQITGKEQDVIQMARDLHELILYRTTARLNGPLELVIDAYNEKLFRLNQVVRLKRQGVVFETYIRGVNAAGKLITIDEKEHQFDFGEVEWVL